MTRMWFFIVVYAKIMLINIPDSSELIASPDVCT